MILLEDTRQQANKHRLKHEYWSSQGIEIVRTKLLVGDYMVFGGTICVDTKMSVEEIAQNIGGREHVRFREECKLAKRIGATLIILVENTEGFRSVEDVTAWVNPNLNKTSRSIEGPRLAKAMRTMSERYGVQFLFCTPEESGGMVLELLQT
jgi:ribosome-associated protein